MFEEPFFAFLQRQVATAPNADARCAFRHFRTVITLHSCTALDNPLLRGALPSAALAT